jgi:hypothetical protein
MESSTARPPVSLNDGQAGQGWQSDAATRLANSSFFVATLHRSTTMSSTVNVTNVFAMQPAYTQLGMGPIPDGITLSKAVTLLKNALSTKLLAQWPSSVPPIGTQQDSGIMGPWSDNIAGSAPSCVVQQITGDFSAWELPSDPTTVNAIAQQITQEISSQGGIAGVFVGETPVGANESIFWGVGYGTCAVSNPSGGGPDEVGVVYLFAAQLGLNLAARSRIAFATNGSAGVAEKSASARVTDVVEVGVTVRVTAA